MMEFVCYLLSLSLMNIYLNFIISQKKETFEIGNFSTTITA